MFCVFKLSYQHFSLHPYRLRRLKEETTNLFSLSRFLGYTAVKGVLNSGIDIVDVDMTSTLLNNFTFTNNYNFFKHFRSLEKIRRPDFSVCLFILCDSKLFFVTKAIRLEYYELFNSQYNFIRPHIGPGM